MWILLLAFAFMQEDPGPPVLKRGPNPPRKRVEDKPATPLPAPTAELPGAAAPAEPERVAHREMLFPGRPELLVRAYEVAVDFDASLPNFVCDEIVDRFESKSKPPKWKKQDRVEVELMYVNGKEDYRNFRINGKPLRSGAPEETGLWSAGDWGTTLLEVLSPNSKATFTPRPPAKERDVIAGIEALVYDLRVQRENSLWTIRLGDPVKPGFSGSIWVDPKTARVLRIEKQTRSLPASHPFDTIEMIVEYGWVTIGGEKFLLPLSSSNLGCQRYSDRCVRNDLQFTNYRKFAAESTISTTESEISFGDAKPDPTPPKAPAKKKNP